MPLVIVLSFSFFLNQALSTTAGHRKALSDAINDASLTPLITERSTGAAVIRAQILLCRARFSVGQIDGAAGTNFRRAVLEFQGSRDIHPTGAVNKATWKALNMDHGAAIVAYRITAADLAGPFEKIPNDWAQMAKLAKMDYESVDDELGERFHSNPELLHKLNPNKVFEADTEIMVPHPGARFRAKAASLVVSKSKCTVTALNGQGKVVAQFPASTGSEHDPLPMGDWKVTTIHYNPTFSYNPDLFWDSGSKQAKELIAPGPRGPVGLVWIGISKEHYGIHGTAVPSDIGHTQSHGCIRMTNWDAMELAGMVGPGTPVHLVEE
jgi:lipoprotein-anchoring transpeptidase ErfK/SrfK